MAKRLKISEATARRDLAALSKSNMLRRTFGGATANAASGNRSTGA
ncbi:MAG: DeoR family transcriptional regulator [Planctomycetota bacterium]